MANPLQRASIRRKIQYLVAILALFTVSMFWRGKLDVPFGNAANPAGKGLTALNRGADRLSRNSILAQSERLDLRELDQGDPEVVGAAARSSLIGIRGPVITVLWWSAIEKQKRNEFHKFELLVRTVTRLQPNFITPWIFQSWNIAYNVSVENDKLGDMYFYIARGIELLAEGDRLNTKIDRTSPEGNRKIGSPDIRFQVGFYYQNKFGVSDKVNTLRCLMQLSCIRPGDRNPDALILPPSPNEVDRLKPFREFCQKNPQLVRRLRTKLNCAQPEAVIDFLRDNQTVPCLYKNDSELANRADQFPVFPWKENFAEGTDEFTIDGGGTLSQPSDDSFDAFLAARSWFMYALTVVPPGKVDEAGDPLPWAALRPYEYDQFKYRMPRSPALIIFRQYGPRSQSYLAERLAKEGWFDESTTWSPDERASTSTAWFPPAADGSPRDVALKSTPSANAKAQWAKAWDMWNTHGQRNGMVLSPLKRQQLEDRGGVRGTPTAMPPEYSPEDIKALGLDAGKLDAIRALIYYEQNRQVTNFAFFLESSRAEKDQITVDARKLLYEAKLAEDSAENLRAIRLYTTALARWREVLARYPQFHRPERSDRTEEETYEFEINFILLLKKTDGIVRARAERAAEASAALFPGLSEIVKGDYLQAAAEDEAGIRIATEALLTIFPKFAEGTPENDAVRKIEAAAAVYALDMAHPRAALAGDAACEIITQKRLVDARVKVARELLGGEFWWLKEFKTKPAERDLFGRYDRAAYWVSPDIRGPVKSRLGLIRVAAPAAQPDGASAERSGP